MILYPVIDIHGPNIDRNFHVDWFDNFLISLTYARQTTDIQTDRQSKEHRHRLKSLPTSWGGLHNTKFVRYYPAVSESECGHVDFVSYFRLSTPF